jgi:hypothetical protein
MARHESLHKDTVLMTAVVYDGPSEAILELRTTSVRRTMGVMFSKEQAEELVRDLQRKLAEM